MKVVFYSLNPDDYKIGDKVRDRVTHRVGVISAIKKNATGGATLQVYVKTLGTYEDWKPENVTILYRNGKPFEGFTHKEPPPSEPRASVKEEIRTGNTPPPDKLGVRQKAPGAYETARKIIKDSLEESKLIPKDGSVTESDLDFLSHVLVENLPTHVLDAIERDHTVRISLDAKTGIMGELGEPVVGLHDTLGRAGSQITNWVMRAKSIVSRLSAAHYSDLFSPSFRETLKRGLAGEITPANSVDRIFKTLNTNVTGKGIGHLSAHAVEVEKTLADVIKEAQRNIRDVQREEDKKSARLSSILQNIGFGIEDVNALQDEYNPHTAGGYQEEASNREDEFRRWGNLDAEYSYYESSRRSDLNRLREIMSKSDHPLDLSELSRIMFNSVDRDAQWRTRSLIHDLYGRPEETAWSPDTTSHIIERMNEASSSSLGMGIRRTDKLAVMLEGFNPLTQKFERVTPVVKNLTTETENGLEKARVYLRFDPESLVREIVARAGSPEQPPEDFIPSVARNAARSAIGEEVETFTRNELKVGGKERSVEQIMVDLKLTSESGEMPSFRALSKSEIGRAFLKRIAYSPREDRDLNEDIASNIYLETMWTLRSSKFKMDNIGAIGNEFISAIVETARARHGGTHGLRGAITGQPDEEVTSLNASREDEEGNPQETLEAEAQAMGYTPSPEQAMLQKEEEAEEKEKLGKINEKWTTQLTELFKTHPSTWNGVNIKQDENGRLYFETDNASVPNLAERLKDYLETGEVNGETGTLIRTANTSYILPDKNAEIEMNWNTVGGSAKSPFNSGSKTPTESIHGAMIEERPQGPHRIVDVNSGISYALEEGGTATLGAQSLLKQVDFNVPIVPEGATRMSELPIWKTKDDVMIGLSMKGGPEEQIQRARKAYESGKYLAIDIETYGPAYERLGSVGIVKSERGAASNILDRSWLKWKTMRNLPSSPTDLTMGNPDEAEVSMLSEASQLLDKHKDLHVLIYNEDVDLGKLSAMAASHAKRLKGEGQTVMADEMEKASAIFKEANENRAINVLFLEQGANPKGGFQSLEHAALGRGLQIEEAQLHGAAYDAAVTAKVFEAGAGDYLGINPNEWQRLSSDDITNPIMYGRPTRSKDAFGNPINLPISNRMVKVEGVFSAENELTGGHEYYLHVNDVSGEAPRVIRANDALDLSVILQNLKPSGLSPEQANAESDRIALDLFQRQLHRLYTGERGGNSPFVHEVIDWRMEYANMPRKELLDKVADLERMVENGENVAEGTERIRWIRNYLINDPRMAKQYVEGKYWYDKQYSVYDKPFFDKISEEIRSGNIDRYEAELLIHRRNRELYGIGGEALARRGFPATPEKVVKPFHEWTITPRITNSYRIRVGDVGQTRYDIEEFALQTFRRKFSGDRNKGATFLTSMGLSRREALEFLESGRFAGNKTSKRGRIASHLISTGFTFENKTISALLAEAAQMPAKSDLGSDVSEMAGRIREYVKTHAEEQLRTNPSLNQEFIGVPLWKTLEEKGYTDTAANIEKIRKYEQGLWRLFSSRNVREGFIRSEEARLWEANPARKVEQLKFSSIFIPKMFKNNKWAPSVLGKTPQSYLASNEKEGYGVLASMLLRNAEREYSDSLLGTSTSFLNMYQKDEIERLLKWRHLDEAIKGVSRGVIRPVRVKDELVDIGKAIVPSSSGHQSFEDFLRSGTAEEILQKARANLRLSGYLQRAAEIYFGTNANPAVPSPVGVVGPGAGMSPAKTVVAALNQEIKNAESKGPSVARAALLGANTWARVSGKARDLVGVLAGRTELSSDALSSGIRAVLHNKRFQVAAGVAKAALVIMATLNAVNTKDEGEYEEAKEKEDKERKVETEHRADIQHQRVRIRVRGKIGGTLNPMHVINAIHTAIDMHTTSPTNRSQTLTEDRSGRERERGKVVHKILG